MWGKGGRKLRNCWGAEDSATAQGAEDSATAGGAEGSATAGGAEDCATAGKTGWRCIGGPTIPYFESGHLAIQGLCAHRCMRHTAPMGGASLLDWSIVANPVVPFSFLVTLVQAWCHCTSYLPPCFASMHSPKKGAFLSAFVADDMSGGINASTVRNCAHNAAKLQTRAATAV